MTTLNHSYQQQVYNYVRNKILTMEYRPGDYISDSQVAKELSISRTPAREAFQRLEIEGLLISEARRGWRIYSLTIKDIEDIFDLKCEIEGLVARRAALGPSEEHHQTLRNYLHRMQEASQNNDVATWIEMDSSLHHLFYLMAHNDRAEKIIKQLNDQWHRLRRGFINLQGSLESATSEHENIANAVIAGDANAAELAMQTHLNNVRQGLLKVLVTMILPYARNGL
jgi:DNA-binding GntR family transcriptional regulator